MKRLGIVAMAGMAAIAGWPVLTGGSVADARTSAGGPRWPAIVRPGVTSGSHMLDGVAAVSASDVWAVGTLIEHWNGHKWSVQAGPKTRNCHQVLLGISAASASRIWAVGRCYNAKGQNRAIIERWDGRHWAVQASPRVGTAGDSALLAVKAISGSSVWAVGEAKAGTSVRTLIEHWNGRRWKIIPRSEEH